MLFFSAVIASILSRYTSTSASRANGRKRGEHRNVNVYGKILHVTRTSTLSLTSMDI
ncbi:hypothetical protein PF005_g11937 [Phytophthora fragariae]|uniref:RxLR effector protein n=1 Tax=Phytophthora fragariae TaxID=53985 RepID=A0A6A3ESY2_9STRA|nr:hypothetical protein PF009_g14397 [Phytophthora fragariae]KAE9066149.1 hypothetical protein PF007_g28588 [Phytophthora fragariae]KAE9081318.1 hypothetical protein PF010_g22037 [Phytophthora fragariae]KAE9104746.1 hypothetical protein PF006_g21827 [Phytophthora fragariae]KAE9174328.1 hypothetical protein PF004_g26692 [Phytophthora fragariae]